MMQQHHPANKSQQHMKASAPFQKTISEYLESRGRTDSLFAETLKKTSKSIDECIKYIFDQVLASGCNGFADEEIYNMAVHYYDEDDIVVKGTTMGRVVVNHSIDKPKVKEEKESIPLGGRDTAKDQPKKPTAKVTKQPVLANQTTLF